MSLLLLAADIDPNDVYLQHELLSAAEEAQDDEVATSVLRHLDETHKNDPLTGAYRLGRAIRFWQQGDSEAASRALDELTQHGWTTAPSQALREQILIDGADEEGLVRHLVDIADLCIGDAKSRHLWRAAQLCANRLGDIDRADELYAQAIHSASKPSNILREWYGASLRHQKFITASNTTTALLQHEIPPMERSALMYVQHEIFRRKLGDKEAADRVLQTSLADDACQAWAPSVATIRATLDANYTLNIKAHLRASELTDDDKNKLAHLCATARSQVLASDPDAAIQSLRQAIEIDAAHDYAVALLEELLRAQGRTDEVVELLRQAATRQEQPRSAEISLLLAGQLAEESGDLDNATNSYMEASRKSPLSISANFALRRLAQATKNRSGHLAALQAAATIEAETGNLSDSAYELAQYLADEQNDETGANEWFAQLTSHESFGPHAALRLLLSARRPEQSSLYPSVHRLASAASESERPVLLASMVHPPVPPSTPDEENLRLPWQRAWQRYLNVKAQTSDNDPNERAASIFEFGSALTDPKTSSELMLHGLRAKLLSSSDADNESYLWADELAQRWPDSPAVAVAVDETLSAADDPDARAIALESRLAYTQEGPTRLAMKSARARTLIKAGRNEEAVQVLRELIEAEPTDLCNWEAMRVAARQCEQWQDVATSCEKLADSVGGELAEDLLEESAILYADKLDKNEQAEALFRKVTETNPTRSLSCSRLSDMLNSRQDLVGLIALTNKRLEYIEDPTQRIDLLYDQARLLRAQDDRDAALRSLQELDAIDSFHIGAIALTAEIYVTKENWRAAIDALQRLAASDVPAAQKRVAHLGASDFLFRHLNDTEGALRELQTIEDLGLADTPVYERIAIIAESAAKFELALQALDNAIAHSTQEQAAQYAVQAAALRHTHLQDSQGAIASYRRAMAEDPTNLVAASSLVSLLSEEDAQIVASGFEDAVRAAILGGAIDAASLRKLKSSALWRHCDTAHELVLDALNTLGVADDAEKLEWQALSKRALSPTAAMRDPGLGEIRPSPTNLTLSNALWQAAPPLLRAAGFERSVHGISRRSLFDASNLSAAVAGLQSVSRFVGLGQPEFYLDTKNKNQLVLCVERKDTFSWVIGENRSQDFDATFAFEAARQAWGARYGTAPLFDQDPLQGQVVIAALLSVCGNPNVDSSSIPDFEKWSRAIDRKMSRKIRKSIRETVSTIQPENLASFCDTARFTADRAGWLFCGDLFASIGAILGQTPAIDRVVTSPRAKDLLIFATSINGARLFDELREARQ